MDRTWLEKINEKPDSNLESRDRIYSCNEEEEVTINGKKV